MGLGISIGYGLVDIITLFECTELIDVQRTTNTGRNVGREFVYCRIVVFDLHDMLLKRLIQSNALSPDDQLVKIFAVIIVDVDPRTDILGSKRIIEDDNFVVRYRLGAVLIEMQAAGRGRYDDVGRVLRAKPVPFFDECGIVSRKRLENR